MFENIFARVKRALDSNYARNTQVGGAGAMNGGEAVGAVGREGAEVCNVWERTI